MPRLQPIHPETATGKAKELLDGVHKKLGMTPNLMRTMANSPAVLEAFLAFNGAIAGGSLSAKLREQIALAVAEANRCDYCLSAHAAIGRLVGLSDEQVLNSRRGSSPDSKVAAALRFARTLVDKRGWVIDEDVTRLRVAGYGEAEIAEIVANVVLNIFTKYFNHVA